MDDVSINCVNCDLWSDKLFTDIISHSDVELQIINSVITNGCVARLFAFLNRNMDVAGVESGTSNGRATDISQTFYEIITEIASMSNNPLVQLKEKMSLIHNIKRSVNTSLTKNRSRP